MRQSPPTQWWRRALPQSPASEAAHSARGWRLAAFALPGAPLLALSVPPIVFLPRYYTEHLGLSAAVVGAIFLAARLFDVFVNPTIGGLQDRTRTPLGRRRAWLIGVTPVVMLMVWAAFIALPPGAPAILVGLCVLSLYMSFAAAMIAHLGWAGELRPDYHGRTHVLGVLQIASTIGQILAMALPAIVQQAGLGDFAFGVQVMGWGIIIALPICVAIAVLSTREPDHAPSPKMGFADAMAALKSNQSLRRILVPDFLVGAAQGIAGTLFLFFSVMVLDLQREGPLLLLIYFVAGLIGAPIWAFLGKKIGKHRALQIASLWWGAGLALVPFCPPGNALVAGCGMALAGIGAVAGTLLLRSMMADVVDEDEVRSGQQRSGLFFGLLLTTGKIGIALGPASLILLAPFGFSGAAGAQNPPAALTALTLLFAGGPFLLNLLVVASLHNYPLDEARQAALRAEIAARRGAS